MAGRGKCQGKLIPLALAMLWVVCVSATHNDMSAAEPSKGESEVASKLDALVDALVNRNPRPRIVHLEAADWEAVFDKDFDWKEQDRVVDAIQNVLKHASPEMWERLVAQANDPRYCLTFNDQAASADNHAVNWSVGRLCQEIASFQLRFPTERATEIIQIGERPIHLPIDDVEDVPKWGEPRSSGKTFVALQITMCQRAIEDLSKIGRSPRDAKPDADKLEQCRARLEAAIEELKKSGTGVFGDFDFPGERYELLDAEMATEIRKRYEEAKNRGDIDAPESETKSKGQK